MQWHGRQGLYSQIEYGCKTGDLYLGEPGFFPGLALYSKVDSKYSSNYTSMEVNNAPNGKSGSIICLSNGDECPIYEI